MNDIEKRKIQIQLYDLGYNHYRNYDGKLTVWNWRDEIQAVFDDYDKLKIWIAIEIKRRKRKKKRK